MPLETTDSITLFDGEKAGLAVSAPTIAVNLYISQDDEYNATVQLKPTISSETTPPILTTSFSPTEAQLIAKEAGFLAALATVKSAFEGVAVDFLESLNTGKTIDKV